MTKATDPRSSRFKSFINTAPQSSLRTSEYQTARLCSEIHLVGSNVGARGSQSSATGSSKVQHPNGRDYRVLFGAHHRCIRNGRANLPGQAKV